MQILTTSIKPIHPLWTKDIWGRGFSPKALWVLPPMIMMCERLNLWAVYIATTGQAKFGLAQDYIYKYKGQEVIVCDALRQMLQTTEDLL